MYKKSKLCHRTGFRFGQMASLKTFNRGRQGTEIKFKFPKLKILETLKENEI